MSRWSAERSRLVSRDGRSAQVDASPSSSRENSDDGHLQVPLPLPSPLPSFPLPSRPSLASCFPPSRARASVPLHVRVGMGGHRARVHVCEQLSNSRTVRKKCSSLRLKKVRAFPPSRVRASVPLHVRAGMGGHRARAHVCEQLGISRTVRKKCTSLRFKKVREHAGRTRVC